MGAVTEDSKPADFLDAVPDTAVFGFTASTGNLKIYLGYGISAAGGVLLYALEQIGAHPPTLWRRFWASRESAVEAAESLAAEVEEYIDCIGGVQRPTENMDLDDFVFHLTSRIKNGFH